MGAQDDSWPVYLVKAAGLLVLGGALGVVGMFLYELVEGLLT